jgi:hypothetical protein
MSETPDELRARLNALAAAATVAPWEVQTHWDVQNGDQGDDRFEDFESAAPFSLIRCPGASIEDTIAEVWGTEHDDVANAALIVALVNAWPEIDNLLARLATAEAERDEWRAMAEGVEDLSDCPWFLGTGTCSYGCHDEPSCQTDRPREGWPTEQHPLVIQLREAVARREQL